MTQSIKIGTLIQDMAICQLENTSKSFRVVDNSTRKSLAVFQIGDITEITHNTGSVWVYSVPENIRFDFTTATHSSQIFSLMKWVMADTTRRITDLGTCSAREDNTPPVLAFNPIVKLNGSTGTWSSTWSGTFSAQIYYTDILNKRDVLSTLVLSATDDRDGNLTLTESNIFIYTNSTYSNYITGAGAYYITFDVSDFAGNEVEPLQIDLTVSLTTSTTTIAPSSTSTPTPTITPTLTSSSTPTPTQTLTGTSTLTPSATLTNTPTNTQTPTVTPTPTLTSSMTNTPTPTPSSTPSVDSIRDQLTTLQQTTYDSLDVGDWMKVTVTEYTNIVNNLSGATKKGNSDIQVNTRDPLTTFSNRYVAFGSGNTASFQIDTGEYVVAMITETWNQSGATSSLGYTTTFKGTPIITIGDPAGPSTGGQRDYFIRKAPTDVATETRYPVLNLSQSPNGVSGWSIFTTTDGGSTWSPTGLDGPKIQIITTLVKSW
ncbi:hypothetical protein EBU71_06830 [bacterium]|nr:hypothetical protein [Candidatus Elulimicrobium humile]